MILDQAVHTPRFADTPQGCHERIRENAIATPRNASQRLPTPPNACPLPLLDGRHTPGAQTMHLAMQLASIAAIGGFQL